VAIEAEVYGVWSGETNVRHLSAYRVADARWTYSCRLRGARLAADVEDVDATLILEKEWEHGILNKVIEAGLL